jgi:hypothetical protein
MSVYYPTMSTDERRSVLTSDLDGDLRAGRWFGAACMAGALAVLEPNEPSEQDVSAWRDAALRDMDWFKPTWLERVATLEADDDIRRLVMLLRIDEAGCGIGWLGAHPSAIIAEMQAIAMIIEAEPHVWGRLGTAALRRLGELDEAPYPNPAKRVWRAVFHAWRATAEEEGLEVRG